MATTEFWQRASASAASAQECAEAAAKGAAKASEGRGRFWICLDALTILASVAIATLYRNHTTPFVGAKGLWRGTLIHGRPMGILLALLCGFAISLVVISRRLNLYSPIKLSSILDEQRLSVQACLTSGLLLTGTLYLLHAEDISRGIVLGTVGLVTVALSLRRLVYRLLLYRGFERGVGTRNVLIVGTGRQAVALRYYLESIRHLGYRFKGFIVAPAFGESSGPGEASPGEAASRSAGFKAPSGGVAGADVAGTLETLFQQTRKEFVDEIFFTTPCEGGVMREVIEQARVQGVDVRMVPDIYDGLAFNSALEYIGQFPTIPLHCGHISESALLLKRTLDMVFSALALILLLPAFAAIATAIKLDSSGPVFYFSERIGKKGRVFRCIKFRTMIRDAEDRRAGIMHLNERRGGLFKIAGDPRITRLGRFLRRYSLDELPQFYNVLRGDMSIVGPRPPIGSEVREYELGHLRRLDVTPGITGLWQVQARQDPSFDSYISLDVTYIENWSIWLDLQIILRTVGVVLAGTGT
jgi:exopolysaccharide biosynthesis polyprenyl glycosylphosphotransferase